MLMDAADGGKNLSTRENTGPCATLAITNATWTDQGLNLVLLVERLASNCLSHGIVFLVMKLVLL